MREVKKTNQLTIITIIISLLIVITMIIKPLLVVDLNTLEFTEMHRQTLEILDEDGYITKNADTIESISDDERTIIQDYNINREYILINALTDQTTIDNEIKQYNDIIENGNILDSNITLIAIAILSVNIILIIIDRLS